jgi:hypothetical protein
MEGPILTGILVNLRWIAQSVAAYDISDEV